MRVIMRGFPNPDDSRVVSVANAVDGTIRDAGNKRAMIEAQAEMIGKLAEHLVAKELITAAELNAMLGLRYRVEE